MLPLSKRLYPHSDRRWQQITGEQRGRPPIDRLLCQPRAAYRMEDLGRELDSGTFVSRESIGYVDVELEYSILVQPISEEDNPVPYCKII